MMGRKRRHVVVNASRVSSTETADDASLAPFDAGDRGEWWWLQPKWARRAWRLEVGGRLVAELRGEAFFSRVTRLRFANAAYEAHRGLIGNVELRAEDSPEGLAKFVHRWTGGGRIETSAGARLEMVPTGFWRRTYELRTEDELVLARFEQHDSFVRHEVRIALEDAARRRDDLPMLLALASAIVFAPKRHSH